MPGRNSRIKLKLQGTGGINQSRDAARPDQLEDALNVWAPNGALRRRPGLSGVGHEFVIWTAATNALTRYNYDVSAGTYNTSDNFGTATDAGDMMYVGFTTKEYSAVRFEVLSNFNPEAVVQYWNGTIWKNLPATLYAYNGSADAVFYTGIPLTEIIYSVDWTTVPPWYYFPVPNDWEFTTVNGGGGYWLRFIWQNSIAGGSLDYVARPFVECKTAEYNLTSAFDVTTASKQARVYTGYRTSTLIASEDLRDTICIKDLDRGSLIRVFPFDLPDLDRRRRIASYAVIPSTDEVIFSYNDKQHVLLSLSELYDPYTLYVGSDLVSFAEVETADFAVGTDAPYDSTLIAQLTEWPESKLIAFHQNRLWAVDDDWVRWSAPVPYHKVWPSLAIEPLEGDSSKTVAAIGYNENLTIFKEDSIYRMVFAELDQFQVPHFIPSKVVSGVGCIAAGSLQTINNALVFLSKNGLYGYNGSSVRKIGEVNGVDTLLPFFKSLNYGIADKFISAVWESDQLYVLGVASLGKSHIDKCLVWDFGNNSFWIWDLRADLRQDENWTLENAKYPIAFLGGRSNSGTAKSHKLVNNFGDVFEFTNIDSDYGQPISCSVKTHPIGREAYTGLRLREVELSATNKCGDISVTASGDDEATGQTTTVAFDSSIESNWGVAEWGVSEWPSERTRVRKAGFDTDGKQVSVTITKDAIGEDFEISGIELGLLKLGKR